MRLKRWLSSILFALFVCLTALQVSADETVVLKESKKISLTMNIGESKQLASPVSGENVKWKSSKKSVVSISKKGLIRAKKKGKAKITVTVDGQKFYCNVTVKSNGKKVTRIKLNKSSKSMLTEGYYSLQATITPANATNTAIAWSSSDEKVAKVDSMGNVQAVAPGTAVIKASAKDGSGKYATCTITVTLDPMEMKTKKMSLSKGSSCMLAVSNLKKNESVTWGTSNKDIATVENGMVTGVKEGTAVIAAKKEKSNKTVFCVVTVTASSKKVNAKGGSAKAQQLLQILKGYSEQVESDFQNGIYWGYTNSGTSSYWSTAIANGNRMTNCALLPRWALRDLGVLKTTKDFYGVLGGEFTFKGTSKSELLEHCEIISVYKTGAQLVSEGNLLPGDIVSMRDIQHTKVYAGDNKWYDAGRGSNYDSSTGRFRTFGPTKAGMNSVIGYIIRLK